MERRPAVKMERRDVRITVRYSDSEATRLADNARHAGEELSRYIRRCSFIGDSVRQAGAA